MTDEIATLLAQKFISRRDAKAIQMSNGDYRLHTADGKREGPRLGWKMGDIRAHISGERTYGHYILGTDDQCKLFAFDIDLEKTGFVPVGPEWTDFRSIEDLRGEWLNRRSPYRSWLKYQFRNLGERLARGIHRELEIPTTVAYSGGKGVHVYGFTGLMAAADVREGANIVLEALGEFELAKGQHFYKHSDTDPESGFPNLSIEVFPKQQSLDGKDLGNLMRLPLGKNMKSTDPTFFLDLRAPQGEMQQRDAIEALTATDAWA